MLGSILFIGGFLVKSFVEERIFQRDTERVLAYYKRVAPNSLHDGNEHGARYLVWKYKGKKDKLWRRLEAKYGMPVKHAWEWDDDEAGDNDVTKNDEEEEAKIWIVRIRAQLRLKATSYSSSSIRFHQLGYSTSREVVNARQK